MLASLSKVQVASPYSLNVFKAFMVVLYFALSIYFTLSVYSLYMIIKIQKKSVTTFLDHDFEGAGKMQKRSFYNEINLQALVHFTTPWKRRSPKLPPHTGWLMIPDILLHDLLLGRRQCR